MKCKTGDDFMMRRVTAMVLSTRKCASEKSDLEGSGNI